MKYIRSLTARHWAWLHFKVVLGIVWPTVLFLIPPTSVTSSLERGFVATWLSMTMLGTIISITGLIMAVQPSPQTQLLGVSVELVGLIFFVAGPVIYFVTQLILVLQGQFEQRAALTVFAYAMVAVLIYRLVIIIPLFRREATDKTKEN